MQEIWKDIDGTEGLYQVSNMGGVRSVNCVKTRKDGIKYEVKGKNLKSIRLPSGYMYVNIYVGGRQKRFYVHRLVASAFIQNPDMFDQVNHKDENKQNNCVDNLEWCTSKYNNNYGTHIERSTKSKYSRGHTRIVLLTAPKAFCIFKSVQEAARFTGYSATTVCDYCKSGEMHNGIRFQYMNDVDFLHYFEEKCCYGGMAEGA